MVLLFRLAEKVATPTSVILMAVNALAGFALHVFVIDCFNSKVETYWLAAIPVVVVGAPLGAYMCTRLNNRTIACILIGLIFLELISSLYLIPLSSTLASICLLLFFVFSLIYYYMSGATYYRPNQEEN
jgi:uncharacterized membrane protein YfcA